MKVKICGNKRIEDALKAIYLGADAVGLLVGQVQASNDFITPDLAKEITLKLPVFCSSVLVTHLINASEIVELAKYIGVNSIQLPGDITPEDALFIKKEIPYIKLIKGLHVTDEASIDKGTPFLKCIDAFLLDSVNTSTNQVGGTGKTHDWSISKRIVDYYNVPVILAGGLNPNNVEEAIDKVGPFGVDVNSGVKAPDGYKDYQKLEDFITKAKRY